MVLGSWNGISFFDKHLKFHCAFKCLNKAIQVLSVHPDGQQQCHKLCYRNISAGNYHLIRQIYNAYDNVLLLLEQKPKHMEYRIMPEGDFLTGFHVGHWNAIGEAYERMKAAVRIVHEKLD